MSAKIIQLLKTDNQGYMALDENGEVWLSCLTYSNHGLSFYVQNGTGNWIKGWNKVDTALEEPKVAGA